MLGNALGALVALVGLFGVGAVVCAIVWTLFAWSGRWYDLASLFRYPARARNNCDLRGLAAWVVLGSPACNPSIFWPKLEHRVCGRSDKTFKQQMVGRRLSQGEAKRFLAEFERRD